MNNKSKEVVIVSAIRTPIGTYRGSLKNMRSDQLGSIVIKEVLKECNKYVKNEQTLALISTVLPGTIRRELAPIVTNTRLIYNPYLIAMGSAGWDMINPEMIIIGTMKGNLVTANRAKHLLHFYGRICDNNPRIEFGTWEEAEAIKIFYNTFISTKISLVNMVQEVAQKLGYIQGKLRAARNNALGFINTPDFKEMQKIWEVNRKAQYDNYYNMFKSYPTVR